MSTGPTQHRILAALAVAGTWADPEWIAQHSGLRADQIESALRRMVTNGAVVRVGLREARKFKLAPPASDLQRGTDFAAWASGGVSIAKDGVVIKLTADEASELVSYILRSPEPLGGLDEFTDATTAALAAAAASGAAA